MQLVLMIRSFKESVSRGHELKYSECTRQSARDDVGRVSFIKIIVHKNYTKYMKVYIRIYDTKGLRPLAKLCDAENVDDEISR